MKRKKNIPAERRGLEVRYAYEDKRKSITVSQVTVDRHDNVTERRLMKDLHPNAKKKALDTAKMLSIMGGRCDVLIIDENLMRDEYLQISESPILIRETA